MREISAEEARTKHQISTLHHEMPNGEFRFRLNKADGTSYIRTEASVEGAWQNSHFHRHVRETYIVQSGWIAYAEPDVNDVRIEVYREGELFTTKPGIVHNIYMPANSVIHTVKHGRCDKPDRLVTGVDKFDSKCKELTGEEKILECDRRKGSVSENEIYSASYRHFDNLIWQVPAWIAAIFALSISGLGSSNFDRISSLSNIAPNKLTIGFLSLVSATIFSFSYVNFRFRMHQRGMKKYKRTPIWKSASSLVQLVINAQGVALLSVALLIAQLPIRSVIGMAVVFLIIVTWRGEYLLRTASTIGDPH